MTYTSASAADEVVPIETVPTLDWSYIMALLKLRTETVVKLTTSGIEKTFRNLSEFSSDNHQAGTPGDEILANKVLTKFKDNGMDPWLDTHFVKVQDLPKASTNKVTFRSKTYPESGYLSYSATGTAQGAILYAFYGRDDDLRALQRLGIDAKDRVLLVRAGKNSYAEKVERDLLSPYVSPQTTPFRHILLGSGSCTMQDVLNQLVAIKEGSASADVDLLKNQFALTTWTIQSCANALVGNVWDMDNDI